MNHITPIGTDLLYVSNGSYYKNKNTGKRINVLKLNGNLSINSNMIGAMTDIVGSNGDNLIVYIKTTNGIRSKIIEDRSFNHQKKNKIDDVRVLDNGHWILIHVKGEGWFFDSNLNNKFVDIVNDWQKKKNVSNAVRVWGMNRGEAEKLWNQTKGKPIYGGSKKKGPKVKGKRVLKNGTIAGYVRQKDGSYRWRFLKTPFRKRG